MIVRNRRGWIDGWFEIWQQQDIAGGGRIGRRVGLRGRA